MIQLKQKQMNQDHKNNFQPLDGVFVELEVDLMSSDFVNEEQDQKESL